MYRYALLFNGQIPSNNVTLTCGAHLPRLVLMWTPTPRLGVCRGPNLGRGTLHAEEIQAGLNRLSRPFQCLSACCRDS